MTFRRIEGTKEEVLPLGKLQVQVNFDPTSFMSDLWIGRLTDKQSVVALTGLLYFSYPRILGLIQLLLQSATI